MELSYTQDRLYLWFMALPLEVQIEPYVWKLNSQNIRLLPAQISGVASNPVLDSWFWTLGHGTSTFGHSIY